MIVCHQCRDGIKYETLYQWLVISGGAIDAVTEKIIQVSTNMGKKEIGMKAVAISSTGISVQDILVTWQRLTIEVNHHEEPSDGPKSKECGSVHMTNPSESERPPSYT